MSPTVTPMQTSGASLYKHSFSLTNSSHLSSLSSDIYLFNPVKLTLFGLPVPTLGEWKCSKQKDTGNTGTSNRLPLLQRSALPIVQSQKTGALYTWSRFIVVNSRRVILLQVILSWLEEKSTLCLKVILI